MKLAKIAFHILMKIWDSVYIFIAYFHTIVTVDRKVNPLDVGQYFRRFSNLSRLLKKMNEQAGLITGLEVHLFSLSRI